MGPGRVHFFFLLHASFRKVQIALFDIWKRTEDIFFNHWHDMFQAWYNDTYNTFLILKHLLKFSNCVQTFSFSLDVLLFIFVVKGFHAHLQFLHELLF